ncbi:MAG: peptidoglycan-associated lipoprotein Pal [Rhodobiaceae bacterium]|nr:peptidoglycan-associated lipoprotein Pal [Rhodobiaceae bacterium]MCC0057270.1 peptidoglycan-associated lipoprotein Pal [Rhodobiaceae bacterium]
MLSSIGKIRGMRVAVVLAAALAVTACARNQSGQDGSIAGQAVPGSAQDFVVNVGDRVYFEVDQTDLTPLARDTLNKQAQWLARYPKYTVTVEGHADERGTREYNLALSARRSTVTRDYLMSLGVQPNRMRTVAYGKERPVAVCSDESCFSQNRRAVTVLNTN